MSVLFYLGSVPRVGRRFRAPSSMSDGWGLEADVEWLKFLVLLVAAAENWHVASWHRS